MNMKNEQLSNLEIYYIVECEGLGYAIQHYMSSDRIADEYLAKKWKQCGELLNEIEDILYQSYVDRENDQEEID